MTSGSPLPKVLPFVFPVLLLSICILFQFNGLYGRESHVLMAQCLAPFAPESGPVGYFPMLGALLRFLIGDPVMSMQVVVWLSFAGLLCFFERLLQVLAPGARVGSRWAFTLVALAFSPALLRAGLTVVGDAPGILFLLGAWYFGLRTLEERGLIWSFATGGFAVLAVFTGPGLLLALLPLLIWVAFEWLHRRRVIAFSAFLLGAALACLPFFWINVDWRNAVLYEVWGRDWQAGHFFSRHFQSEHGQVSYLLPNLAYVFSFFCHPFLGLGVAGLFLLFKRTDLLLNAKRVLAFSILGYLLWAAGLPEQDVRYLLPAYVLFLLILFPAWDRFYCYGFLFFPRLTAFLLALMLGLQLFFSVYLLAPVLG